MTLPFNYQCKTLKDKQVAAIAEELMQRELRRRRETPTVVHIKPTHEEIAHKHGTTERTVKRIKRRMMDSGYWAYRIESERRRRRRK